MNIMFCRSGETVPSPEMEKTWTNGTFVIINISRDGVIKELFSGHLSVPEQLKAYAEDLALFLKRLGFACLVITDLLRKFDVDKRSYHSILQAFDWRIWNLKPCHRSAVRAWAKAQKYAYPQIEMVWESDHVHVEFENNHPLIKGETDNG